MAALRVLLISRSDYLYADFLGIIIGKTIVLLIGKTTLPFILNKHTHLKHI